MGRPYAAIVPSFWTGKTGRSLRGDPVAWTVAAYLVSSPHANMTGCYYLPTAFIEHDTGLPAAEVSRAVALLVADGFVVVDSENEWVWVREMARFQIDDDLKENDKRVKGIARLISAAPCGLRWAFVEKYGKKFHLEAPLKLLESPSEAKTGTRQDQEQEQQQEQEGARAPTAATSVAPFPLTAQAEIKDWHNGDPLTVPGHFAQLSECSGGTCGCGLSGKTRGLAQRILAGGPVEAWEYREALDELKRQNKLPNTGLLVAVVARRRTEAGSASAGGPIGAREKPVPGRGWLPFEDTNQQEEDDSGQPDGV